MIWTYILKISINTKTIYEKEVCTQKKNSSNNCIKNSNCEITNTNATK